MQNKRWIAAALLAGFILGNGMAPAQAGILDKVIKGGVTGYAVTATADTLNSAINTVTAKYGVSSTDATKVVPIISVGDGSRAGAAQVSGPQSKVDQVKAALIIEQTLLGVRVKVLLPVDSVDYKNVNRVQGVGVSASLDYKL
jgi:hypothetical protein